MPPGVPLIFEPTTLPATLSPPQICSASKCKKITSAGYKTCDRCREQNRRIQARKRQREKEAEDPQKRSKKSTVTSSSSATGSDQNLGSSVATRASSPQHEENSDEELAEPTRSRPITHMGDIYSFFHHLKQTMKASDVIDTFASYSINVDPLMSDKDQVRWTANEIWRITGYRFRVDKNPFMKTGFKTVHYCCQDANRIAKAKPSKKPGVRPRKAVGMNRFPCQSCLNISCRTEPHSPNQRLVTVKLVHRQSHFPYHDIPANHKPLVDGDHSCEGKEEG